MDLTKLVFESEKIIGFKIKISTLLYVVGGGVCLYVCIMIFVLTSWNNNENSNVSFYQNRIIGTVTDVYSDERDVWYKIGQNWYVIINPMTNNLAIGDSVFKESNSHDIIIFGVADNIKSKGEIEDVGFILLEGMHPKDIKK